MVRTPGRSGVLSIAIYSVADINHHPLHGSHLTANKVLIRVVWVLAILKENVHPLHSHENARTTDK